MLELDHIALAVTDLDSAGTILRDGFGLASYAGGAHRSGATANRIVPLHGGAYLELIQVIDAVAAAADPLGTRVAQGIEAPDAALIAWAVRTSEIDAVASRLGIATTAMGRSLPDGTRLSWRVAGIVAALESRYLPFFIEWDQPELHPSLVAAPHGVEAPRIQALELAGDRTRLGDWLGDELAQVHLGVEHAGGAAQDGIRSVDIRDRHGARIQLTPYTALRGE
jgi:hypothetical protein